MKTMSPAKRIKLLATVDTVLERLQSNRLTRVSLLHLNELPCISGVYLAVDIDDNVLYIGKANRLTERCKISKHHKLPSAIQKGAVALLIASVPIDQAWHVEQVLIDLLSPSLNENVARWWMSCSPKVAADVQTADMEIIHRFRRAGGFEALDLFVREHLLHLAKLSKGREQIEDEDIEDF